MKQQQHQTKRINWQMAFLLLPLLLGMLPGTAQAQFRCATNNGTITILEYTGSSNEVSIPDTINGLPVTSLGDFAFASEWTVTRVTIPNSVITIGSRAFLYCPSLTNITIPDSVLSIGDYSFSSCGSVASLTIGRGLTNIGNGVFAGFASLAIITVDAFNPGFSSVDGVLFNKSQSALLLCPAKALNYTIPNSVTSLGDRAFDICTRLTNIVIPSSVTNIGRQALSGCLSMTNIAVDALNSAYQSVNGILFNKSQTLVVQYPAGKPDSTYAIPNSVTNIGYEAFRYCTNLTNVTFGNSVTSIEDRAFRGCYHLTSAWIPGSVTSIGSEAFSECINLTNVTIPGSVTMIGSDAFSVCTRLTSIRIPDGITRIANGTFSRCSSLTNVVIPGSVTNLGDFAFSGCTSLTSVTIPRSVASIGGAAFNICTSLKGVYFEGNAPAVDASAFTRANNAIGFYVPDTTGWGLTFAGRPTAVWQPMVLATGPNFGVRTNRFGFDIAWASDRVLLVEACTNLAQPVWSIVGTNTLTGGASYFSDPAWTNHATRYYRLRSP